MALRTSRNSRIALAALLAVLIGGCGDDSDPATNSTDASTTDAATPDTSTVDATTTAVGPNVEQYLLQADEVPGLVPILSPHSDTAAPFELPEDGEKRLQRSGYISTTYQSAEGDGAGFSSVLLFETAAGARDWMAYETSDELLEYQLPDSKLERFQVPGIPGATGWTGPDLHGNAIGQVYWTQGRCMILVGLEVPGPRVERLSAGAKAIYERTGGTCPD